MNEIDTEIPEAEFLIRCFFSQSSGIFWRSLMDAMLIIPPGEAGKIFMIQMKIIWILNFLITANSFTVHFKRQEIRGFYLNSLSQILMPNGFDFGNLL